MNDSHRAVYRVISGEDWEIAQRTGVVPRCGADERDGFVHLSTADTMLETANLYFEPAEAPLIIEVLTRQLGAALRWEEVASRGDKLFPHLYAPGIPYHAITAHIALEVSGGVKSGFTLGARSAVSHAGEASITPHK